MEWRNLLASFASGAVAGSDLPANRTVKWALSAGLWSHYPPVKFTDILDVMQDTGFIGIRLTGYPGILKKYNLTASRLEREISKRNLYVATISFGGRTNDPKLFNFAPDTAHLYLGGSNVVDAFKRYRNRLVFMDYKDARWTTPQKNVVLPNGQVLSKDSSEAKFFDSIYDLGDGNIDFPACHRILKQIAYKGWICVDLDTTRKGPLASYWHCDRYIVNRLQPIYL